MTIHEQDIRELAYYLWISEGKPDGQSSKYWAMATKMVTEKNKNNNTESKRSTDPSEATGPYEPEQPDQT